MIYGMPRCRNDAYCFCATMKSKTVVTVTSVNCKKLAPSVSRVRSHSQDPQTDHKAALIDLSFP